MGARRCLQCWLAAFLLCACTQRIEVLGAGGASMLDGGGGSMRDAEDDNPPASDASQSRDAGSGGSGGVGGSNDAADAAEDAELPIDPCGGCEVQELCAVDRCVSSTGIQALDAHLFHTCMVRDARAYCWGENDYGQVGVGDRDNRLAPARIGVDNDWLAISTGEKHGCGIRAPGILYCWGRNHLGQLGVGDTNDRMLPERAGSAETLWRTVTCGGDGCCAIDRSDALYCWGDNSEGKVGQLDGIGAPDAVSPTRVDTARWQRVTVGQGHVCGIRDNGELYCWARNSTVELGIGPEPGQVRGPTRVGDAADWIDITSSQHSTCGLRALGKIFCWGLDTHHELGGSVIDERVAFPRLVGVDADWKSVHAGWFHTCARKQNDALYCWGRAIEGQLAQGGGETPVQEASLVTSAPGFTHVALGNFYTCGVTGDGALQCWGANDRGQLGTGDTERRYEPATIP